MSATLYQRMRLAAAELRSQYGIVGPRVTKSQLRSVYRDQGIAVNYWPHRLKRLRGAYFYNDGEPTVMIAKQLPDEQQIFTLAHELKHHLVDRAAALAYCDPSNQNAAIEIAAEVFAAELIFPQQLFVELMESAEVDRGSCTADDIIRLKVESRTTLSYAGLVKMAEFLGFCDAGAFSKVKFRKRQEELFGEPIYKRLHRNRSSAALLANRSAT